MAGAEHAWHALTPADAVARLGTDPARGLSEAEVLRRRAAHGRNELPEPRGRTRLSIFLGQFASPLVYLLFAAAAVAAALGERTDAAVILAVVLLNATVGAFQEGRAERSLAALRRLVVVRTRVRREGVEEVVDARDLVPGDVLVLAAGDRVAADARLLDVQALSTAEAALTGESTTVGKDASPLPEDAHLADRRNMVYAGTHVTAGRGLAAVTATGTASEIGRIATLTAGTREPATPLQRRVERAGRALLGIAGVVLALVVAVGALRGIALAEILVLGISQVVSLVPEGLPVALTIALAVGVSRMSARGAIVRRLAAVETLGSVTVIASDKTGTLTRNEMTVVEVRLPGASPLRVLGLGYGPDGGFHRGEAAVDPAAEPGLRPFLEALALCNDAVVAPSPEDGGWRPLGDPTEAAFVAAATRARIDVDALRRAWPRRGEVPFDPERRLMATAHEAAGRGRRVLVKGSPEAVLPLCARVRRPGGDAPLDEAARAEAAGSAAAMAGRGLRVLAAAVAEDTDLGGGLEGLRGRAAFLGLVGEEDPPRAEVPAAVARAREAGIRSVMITGDQPGTGRAVARAIGLAHEDDRVLSGSDLDALGARGLADAAPRAAVYARVRPEQKLRIVEALQASGEVVAVTGDGVNDAPALTRADVGIAMGLSGTEAAREASKVVLTDDNFATIVAAVREGRVVYRNLHKAILLQLSTSVAEVLVLMGALVLGLPPPLAAVQILWNNVVTETVITVNLVLEPAEGDEMRVPPVPVGEGLLPRRLVLRAVLLCLAIAASVLGFYAWHLRSGSAFASTQTATFTVLAVCEWFNVLNVRSATRSAFDPGIFRNLWLVGGLVVANLLQAAVVFLPPLRGAFRTVALPWHEVFLIAAAGSLVLWAEEIRKALVRRRAARRAAAP